MVNFVLLPTKITIETLGIFTNKINPQRIELAFDRSLCLAFDRSLFLDFDLIVDAFGINKYLKFILTLTNQIIQFPNLFSRQ